MSNTSRMNWPFPNENQEPWYQALENFSKALDASGFASREDRQLILIGGGTITWDASTSTLTWTGAIQVISPISGFLLSIAAGSVTISDGQVLYATLVRAPTRNLTVEAAVENQVPQSDTAYLLAARVGDDIYWRNGTAMGDGDSISGITIRNLGAGGKDWQADLAEPYLYTLAPVPVEEVVGQGVFDGSRASAGTVYAFGMLTPTFATAGVAQLRIYDTGPAAGPPTPLTLIATLSTSVAGGPQYLEQALTIGASPAAGQIANSARMYELRALMTGTVADTLFVGGGGMDARG
jgi:hypothetical protein